MPQYLGSNCFPYFLDATACSHPYSKLEKIDIANLGSESSDFSLIGAVNQAHNATGCCVVD